MLLLTCTSRGDMQAAAVSSSASFSSPPVVLTAATTRLELSGKMAFLKDEGRKLTIADVASSADVHPLPRELNQGFTQAAIWLRVEVKRAEPAPDHWLLEITNPVHDDVRLYTRMADGHCLEHRAGEDVPRDLKEMDYRQAVFKLDLPTTDEQTLWVRIASQKSLSAKVLLWQPEAFYQGVGTEAFFYGAYFGIYGVILLFHLFFWRWTREPVSGWYTFYVSTNLTIAAISSGYFQQYIQWPSVATDSLLAILLCGAIWTTTMFAQLQLELESVMPRTRRAMVNMSAVLSVTFIALALGIRYSAGVMPAQIVSIIWAVALIAIPLRLWWRGHSPARFFTIAFSVFIAGTILRYLRTLGIIAPSLLTDYSYQIGSIVHMMMMSLAITGHYNKIKREKLEAQAVLAESLEELVMERTSKLVEEIDRREKSEQETRRALDVEIQARQEQHDFVAMVSHEFRTPLAIINTVTQQLANNLDASRDKSVQRCTNIRESARRMTDMMDEFMSFDRVSSELRLKRSRCDLQQLIMSVVDEWESERVQAVCENLPESFVCDAALLRVALRNLVSNATRYSPVDMPVMVTAKGIDTGVEIIVADEGSGIPSDEIPKLFQKYFRGRASQSKPGAGLGLFLVERIANLHGGSVCVKSTQGQGSKFVLTLPEVDN